MGSAPGEWYTVADHLKKKKKGFKKIEQFGLYGNNSTRFKKQE
jgi:hypothetical protein